MLVVLGGSYRTHRGTCGPPTCVELHPRDRPHILGPVVPTGWGYLVAAWRRGHLRHDATAASGRTRERKHSRRVPRRGL